MNVFAGEDYRRILYDSLAFRKSLYGSAFTYQGMAKACKVQKAYLSTVLRGNGHLSSDQIYRACRYLGFGDKERRFLLLLAELSRSEDEGRRSELEAEVAQIRDSVLQTDEHLSSDVQTGSAELAPYYFDANLQLIHMFLSIDEYARDPSRIAAKLRLSFSELNRRLESLQELGIIELQGGSYRIVKDNIHLSAASPLYPSYRILTRLKAIERLQSEPSSSRLGFSVYFSADHQTRDEIHRRFLDFLRDAESLVRNSSRQEVFQLNCDLLSWSEVPPNQ